MPTVSAIINFRSRRRIIQSKNPRFRLGLGFAILISVLMVTAGLVGVWFYTDLTRNLPSVDLLPSLLDPVDGFLLQPTRLYDRTVQHVLLTLENPAATEKKYLYVGGVDRTEEDKFSAYLIDATIARLDPNFWKHSGYSLSGWSPGIHPTIAQRLISDLVLAGEPASIKRNLRERILAAQITYQYGREKILEWYLNSAQYGYLIYGADAAAHVYFGKSASALSLAEAVMLAAISESPVMDTHIVSQRLKQRQDEILQALLDRGDITSGEAKNAKEEIIQVRNREEPASFAPAFTGLVLTQLAMELPLDQVFRGGYEIITTLDYDLQLQADCASKVQELRIYGAVEPMENGQYKDCEAAPLLPTLQLNPGNPFTKLNTEIVILTPISGQILVYVGDGRTGSELELPREHSAGSILSPYLYLTAFARGMSPGSMLLDIPEYQAGGEYAGDQNIADQEKPIEYHGPVRARIALVNDYVSASEQVLRQVDATNVWLTEQRFGITPTYENINSLTTLEDLYSQKISLLEIVSGYAVFANQGIQVGYADENGDPDKNDTDLIPTSIIRVIGGDGSVRLDWSFPQSRSITSPHLTYLLTQVLSDESARWPSFGHPNPLEIGRPVAAKAGVTSDRQDAWTVGYTPDLVIGVWMGQPTPESNKMTAEQPAGLWHAMMQYSSSKTPVHAFNIPTGISLVEVCDPSGLLVSTLCPAITQEVFLAGNEPSQVDNLYRKLQINRETGLLATVFTPTDLVEEKIYLVVPPEAKTWAGLAGLPIPPDAYDVIYAPKDIKADVQIGYPGQSDYVSGKVSITGSATGPDFANYRLQVGQGLNPQQWIQIGEDEDIPVEEGPLGTWDTTGLAGPYVIELLVVRLDQRIDRAFLQVLVDNTLPQAEILSPNEGERISYQVLDPVMIQVSPSDNLAIRSVEFIVDGKSVSKLIQPPYIILWPLRIGEHSLLVKVYDLAGNMGEATVTFSVEK